MIDVEKYIAALKERASLEDAASTDRCIRSLVEQHNQHIAIVNTHGFSDCVRKTLLEGSREDLKKRVSRVLKTHADYLNFLDHLEI